jgi:hypothetical protein
VVVDPAFGLSGDWRADPAYPFTKWFYTGYKPEGALKAVRKLWGQAWPKFVPIIEAAVKHLQTHPEIVSIYYPYKHPSSPRPHTKKYAEEIIEAHGHPPAGLGDLDFDIKATAIEAVKEAAIDSVTKAAAAQFGAQAVPVAQVAVQVADIVKNYKDLLDSEESRWQAGFTLTSASAAAFSVPVLGWLGGAAAVIKGVVDFHKAKSEAEKEANRAEQLQKMMKSAIDIAVLEAKQLAETLANRRVPMSAKAAAEFDSRLNTHYKQLVLRGRIRDPLDLGPVKDAQAKVAAVKSSLKRMVNARYSGDKNVNAILKGVIDKVPGAVPDIRKISIFGKSYWVFLKPGRSGTDAVAFLLARLKVIDGGLDEWNKLKEAGNELKAAAKVLGDQFAKNVGPAYASWVFLDAKDGWSAVRGIFFPYVGRVQSGNIYGKGWTGTLANLADWSTGTALGDLLKKSKEWNDRDQAKFNKAVQAKWSRRDYLRMFLQMARDMKKLRLKIEKIPAFTPENEIKLLAEAIVQQDKNIPYTAAANIAGQFIGTLKHPLPPDIREKLAVKIAAQLQAARVPQKSAMLAKDKKGGLLPLAAAVTGIALLLQ